MHAALGVDQATRSGWAVVTRDGLEAWGAARHAKERQDAAQTALAAGVTVMFLEDHSDTVRHAQANLKRGLAPKTNASAILTLGAARGYWDQAFFAAGGSKSVAVKPCEWRAAVLGLRPKTSRGDCKRAAIQWALARYNVATRDDEAEAIAIAYYGFQSLRLGAI